LFRFEADDISLIFLYFYILIYPPAMKPKSILIFFLILISLNIYSQSVDTINKTDKNGMKQGHWIKKYPNGHVQYNGYFKDNHPVGPFKRYFENDTIQSVLVFSNDGKEAFASFYHPNGLIASKGKFINQQKEGKWRFFSSRINGYLVCEEEYKGNIREGLSLKFYPDSSLAEKVSYLNDLRNGEWLQYFPNRIICLRANYAEGKLNGSFSTYFNNGKPEYTGQYKDDTRNGTWIVYDSNGTFKYNIEYVAGRAVNSEKFKKESEFLDTLEKNKGKIADPAITGTIW
jgi:antitoxin component YwqK of YwqJK toxin-antitoxin module